LCERKKKRKMIFILRFDHFSLRPLIFFLFLSPHFVLFCLSFFLFSLVFLSFFCFSHISCIIDVPKRKCKYIHTLVPSCVSVIFPSSPNPLVLEFRLSDLSSPPPDGEHSRAGAIVAWGVPRIEAVAGRTTDRGTGFFCFLFAFLVLVMLSAGRRRSSGPGLPRTSPGRGEL